MDQNKELIAYCGLYCGNCVRYHRTISKLAKELHSILEKEKIEKIAKTIKGLKNFDEFFDNLDILSKFECSASCRDGGGSPDCEVRTCCKNKGYFTCAECDKFNVCPELAGVPMWECNSMTSVKELQRICDVGIDKWLEEKSRVEN